MTGREIPRHPGERHQDPARRAYDPRPDKLRRTGREASGPHTRGGFSRLNCPNKFFVLGGWGACINFNSPPFPLPAPPAPLVGRRRHSRLPYTATAAPGPGREDGPQITRRTGGPGPGRQFSKMCLHIKRSAANKSASV